MKWQDVDARFPETPLPSFDLGGGAKWKEWGQFVDALLTHFTRDVLGFSTGPMDPKFATTQGGTWICRWMRKESCGYKPVARPKLPAS